MTRRRSPRGGLGSLLAAALAAGCGGGAGPSEPPEPSRQAREPSPAPARTPEPRRDSDALRDLVERRVDALGAGNVRAYAATATSARRARDARTARNARGLRLRETRIDSFRVQTRGRRATLRVGLSYRVAGVRGRWRWLERVRAVRGERGWRVAAARTREPRPPWEIAAYETVATRHFRVLVPAGVDPTTVGLSETLEEAYALMRDRLAGSRLDRRYLVLIAADGQAARELTPDLRGVDQLTAVTDLTVRTAGAAQRVTDVVSLRVLVPWPAFSGLAPDARMRAIAHELTHAALAERTSGRTPAWLQEAIALYVSGDRRTDQARAALALEADEGGPGGLSLRGLAAPSSIGRLDASSLSAAYAYSSAAGFYIAERFGERRLLALLDVFGSERLSGSAGRALNAAAVRRILGVGLPRLERDLRRWVQAGVPDGS